jgi:predicted metalloprotease with PDZ domain
MRWFGYCRLLLAASLLLAAPSVPAQSVAPVIHLSVDLHEAPRRIFHARLVLPARPGPMALLYPEWIPGEHAPDGPVGELVGLRFTAGGKTIPWRRDDVNMYMFHLDVPEGATSVEAAYDYLTPALGEGFSAGPSADSSIAVLEWNLVVLYPAGLSSDSLMYQASLRMPQGWKFASALRALAQAEDHVEFAPVSLTTLVDSPVLAGEYFRSVVLAPDVSPPHRINIAADNAAALEIPADQLAGYSRLVREEGALFGARHYGHYDFLLSLTNNFHANGLEHQQSSDERAPEHMFLNPEQNLLYNSLLAHEFTHSWNGKYRRPMGLATPDFNQPMKDDLLWVYEGLTQYIGEMISARSGLRTPDDYREALASAAAYLDHRPGRTWRSLEDTAVAAPFLYNENTRNWSSWRRGTDFYEEGWLIWLDADMIIRQQSHGQRSLDDFCRRFYGAPDTGPELLPYTLDDLLAALNEVLPYDWRGFFQSRVYQINEHAPVGGIENGGWRLIYSGTPNQQIHAREDATGRVDFSFSLGMSVETAGGEKNGRIADVIPGTPAAEAGLAPAMRIVSVNGHSFSAGALRDAVESAHKNAKPILVTADNGGVGRSYEIQYHGGERYPHLERNSGLPDLLGQSLQPLTPPKP